MPDEERKLIEAVLLDYAHMFHDEQAEDFKGTDVEHQVLLEDTRPIWKPQYRLLYALREENQVEELLRNGVIRESKSPCSNPAILVPKRKPDGKTKFMYCVDFRALHSATKFDNTLCSILGDLKLTRLQIL